MKYFWLVVMGVAAACGKVSSKQVDAPVQVDAPKSTDSPMQMDAPAQGATALAADDITSFTIPNATFAKVPYTSVSYDDLGEYDVASSTFTPKAAGDYFICASLLLPNANLNTTFFELDVFKNGVRDRPFAYGPGLATGCRAVRLTAGDAVDIRTWQTSGGNISPAPDPNWNYLTIQRLPATAMVENTATMSLPNATFVTVPYANEIFDDANQFDPASNHFTAAAAGDYLVCASKALSNTLTAEGDLFINGTRDRGFFYGTNGLTGCRPVRLAAGDVVDIELNQVSGSTQSIPASIWDWVTFSPLTLSVYEQTLTPFTATGGQFTKIPYTTEAFDTNGEFDVGTSTFTAANAGDYLVCASLASGNSNFGDEIDIYKNGTRTKGIHYFRSGTPGCRVERLAAHDQLQVFYYDPATTNVPNDAPWTYLDIAKLR